jgi:predicted GTPase
MSTGGWVVNSDDVMEEKIKQVRLIEEADVILFVVDFTNVTDLTTV